MRKKDTLLGRVFCKLVFCLMKSGLEVGWSTPPEKELYPNCAKPPKPNNLGSNVLQENRWILVFAAGNSHEW